MKKEGSVISSKLTLQKAMKELYIINRMVGHIHIYLIPKCFLKDLGTFMKDRKIYETEDNEIVINFRDYRDWYQKVLNKGVDYSIKFSTKRPN